MQHDREHIQPGGTTRRFADAAHRRRGDRGGERGDGHLAEETAWMLAQPTEEQLQRFIDELQKIPPPLDMDRIALADHYHTLDSLQAIAHGEQPFPSFRNDRFSPGISKSLALDWNVVMRRVNASYQFLDRVDASLSLKRLTRGNLFLGVRSRHVADYLTSAYLPPSQALKEARRRTDCSGNFRRIALAMLVYDLRHGTLPAAYTVDANGQPLHSWRVLLLPKYSLVGMGKTTYRLSLAGEPLASHAFQAMLHCLDVSRFPWMV